eukprot:CAMPEP_0196601898 /NCGR_PEP_ID=MMETSP1081-20130531/96148_1 /TAXON_ID=36882 /ORGANISM="Pyramimonas amylifera, Strain CCMP720" /LENGTH=168 /DNA_ID=CAMNT_0041927795 /DNA_START=458 /DNA_END=964 /DNA_ORIENTATION=-
MTGIWALQLTELRGEDIFNGLYAVPDPYVTFLGHSIQKEVVTPEVKRSSNPSWTITNESPIMLPLTAPYESAILNSNLLLCVNNTDRKDEYLGSGHLCLGDLVRHRVKLEHSPWEFTIPLIKYGSSAGKLVGRIKLVRIDYKESWFTYKMKIKEANDQQWKNVKGATR